MPLTESLRALMTELIDYAGMFPPANLSLEAAYTDYRQHQATLESWMLARFIVPATRLADLTALVDAAPQGAPLRLTVVGAPAGHGAAYAESTQLELDAIKALDPARYRVENYEVRVPTDAANSGTFVLTGLDGDSALRVFYEVPLTDQWEGEQAAAARRIEDANRVANRSDGLKLRCGGTEASAFPSAEQVAYMLNTCRDSHIPLKLTAGLHHPFRHHDAALGVKQHGFINVVGAAVLTQIHQLSWVDTQRIVQANDPATFQFTDAALTWGEWSAGVEQITAARVNLVTALGSCSFDEPRHDLKAHGLL